MTHALQRLERSSRDHPPMPDDIQAVAAECRALQQQLASASKELIFYRDVSEAQKSRAEQAEQQLAAAREEAERLKTAWFDAQNATTAAEAVVATVRTSVIAQVKALIGEMRFDEVAGCFILDADAFLNKVCALQLAPNFAVLPLDAREQAIDKVLESARQGWPLTSAYATPPMAEARRLLQLPTEPT